MSVYRQTFNSNLKLQKSTYQKAPLLLNATTYCLNKSRSKTVYVGLQVDVGFPVRVQLLGQRSDQYISFHELEWHQFVGQRLIDSYFTSDLKLQPLTINTKVIRFLEIEKTKVIKIEDGEQKLFLAAESWTNLCDTLSVIKRRIDLLKSFRFDIYYNKITMDVINIGGDVCAYMESMIAGEVSNNALTMHEMLKYVADTVRADVEIQAAMTAVGQGQQL